MPIAPALGGLPTGYALLAGAHLFFLGHAVWTRAEYWWYLVLLFVPIVGAGAYFLVVFLPHLQDRRTLQRTHSGLLRLLDPERDIRRLQEQIEVADTVENRLALAEAYLAAGRHDEAIGIYRECLQGPIYRDDPMLLFALAQAEFAREGYPAALEALQRIRKLKPDYRPHEVQLRIARCHEGQGRPEQAVAEYRPLVRKYPGEEPKCRLAQLLEAQGQPEKAQKLWKDVVVTARRSPAHYRQAQQVWIALARKNLK